MALHSGLRRSDRPIIIGKKWQLFHPSRIIQQPRFWSSGMDDKFPLRVAVDQAWTVHLATHTDIDAADPRRCSLERYLSERWEAGESDPEELTCRGLSYLARLRSESW